MNLLQKLCAFIVVSCVSFEIIASSPTDGKVTDDLKSSFKHNLNHVVPYSGNDKTEANNNETTQVKKPTSAESNCTTDSNDTICQQDTTSLNNFWQKMVENRDMLFRTMYVLLGVTAVVIIYFVIKAVRLRRKRNKSRKYGVIATRNDVEMEPLGHGEDEDEDYTVFEMNGRSK